MVFSVSGGIFQGPFFMNLNFTTSKQTALLPTTNCADWSLSCFVYLFFFFFLSLGVLSYIENELCLLNPGSSDPLE